VLRKRKGLLGTFLRDGDRKNVTVGVAGNEKERGGVKKAGPEGTVTSMKKEKRGWSLAVGVKRGVTGFTEVEKKNLMTGETNSGKENDPVLGEGLRGGGMSGRHLEETGPRVRGSGGGQVSLECQETP